MPLYRSQGIDTSKIDDGFSALAKAFAPPTAQEMLAGAKIREIRDQQNRIADLYANPGQADFDRRAIAAGLQTGTTSLYAVDQNNATSRSNNAADNARALQQARLQQQGETTRTLLAPVGQNATRFNPPTIADAYGLPATQVGAVDLKPGEQVALPDGRTLAGAPKPMTMDEVKAATFGTLPPEQQAAITFGATPIQAVQTPAGPRNVTGPQSLGQVPAPAATAPTNLGRLQAERGSLPAGDPRIAEYDAAIAAEGRGATADPFRTQADTDAAKTYTELHKAAQAARSFNSNIDMLGELLTDAPTGITAPARLKVANYARDIGLNDVADGLTGGRMDRMTAANAIVQRLAPALRTPGSGAQSDRELQNFLASLPSLATQPGGNKLILDTLRGSVAYNQAVGDIAGRALRGEISRADADAQMASVPTPFARFSASRASGEGPSPSVQPVRVTTLEEARRLPSGTPIILPDGSMGRVP